MLTNSFSQQYISPFNFPLFLSGTFGELRDNHFHTGIDIKTNEIEGREILSIEDGYVSRIKVSTWGYGKVLYINHPDGRTSVYAHMMRFNDEIESLIQARQYQKESFEVQLYPEKNAIQIKQGEVIGLSGNTGGSGGPHLHFEIRDTKTERPLNPLNIGFDIADNIDPVITEIILYPHENSFIGKQNKSKRYLVKKNKDMYMLETNDTIKVHGNISFGISTFDRQNGAPNNKNGVYSIKLFVNNKLIHHFQVDELSFSENRFINAHIDYEEYHNTNTWFNRCYKLPYNILSNYIFDKNNGIINFTDNRYHDIRFEIRDIKENLSVLRFQIQSESTPPIIKNTKKNDQLMFNQSNIYTNDKMEVHMEKYTLYQNYDISYSRSKKLKSTLSEIHNFMKSSIPAQKEFAISIKSDIPDHLQEKVYISKIRKDSSFVYKGKTWRNEFLSAKTKEFGSYCIVADTINPIISSVTINQKNNIFGGVGSLSAQIKDNESGISYYRGEINGNWILMEYEHKKDLLTYHIPSDFKKGEYTITILVRDRLNNETKISQNFTY